MKYVLRQWTHDLRFVVS